MKTEFDDFMQDMYDEEELQYMDSGFVNALRLAFNHGWQASRQSQVVKLPKGFMGIQWKAECTFEDLQKALDAAGVRYE
jgi:hypothetical protein